MTPISVTRASNPEPAGGNLDTAISCAKKRIIPFLILMYMLAYLDRVNIGFAKPAYQASTGVSDAAFAFGAGVFFLSYAVFELPSNLILHRVGARRWLARIMVTWGLVSACMIFATTDTRFSLLRLVLGATEAGLFPGAVYHLTSWFPRETRGKILSIFYFGSPLALTIGGPLSGFLLDLDGTFGLHGWQLMFLFEGLVTAAVGVVAFFYLTDKPADATWMNKDERDALQQALAQEESEKTRHGVISLRQALWNPRLLHLAAIYLLIQVTGLGVAFYLPTQVAALLGTKIGLKVGLVSAIPWLFAMLAGFFYPDWAVRTGRRQTCLLVSLLAIGIGLVVSAQASPIVAIAALCFVTMGIMTAQPIFWTYPTAYLGGIAAAAGFALINSVGGIGGFIAPNIRVAAEHTFGSPAFGLYAIAMAAFLAVILALFLPRADARADPAS